MAWSVSGSCSVWVVMVGLRREVDMASSFSGSCSVWVVMVGLRREVDMTRSSILKVYKDGCFVHCCMTIYRRD